MNGIFWLSDQGSNLDFPESKSGVLPVTPSDNFQSFKTLKNLCQLTCRSRPFRQIRRLKAEFWSAKVGLFFKNGRMGRKKCGKFCRIVTW